ncbi:response regulator receiver domain protein [Medicago truncatula]|uniref:Response regulator receiver domain protein n=1 Tax=Medicago truncatula TaxID=3880 RepID=G7KPX8_MEDTR|nr:response regulator receiver domain protein [Medicago truncatula]
MPLFIAEKLLAMNNKEKCKKCLIQTAKDAHHALVTLFVKKKNALVTLRNSKGLFDLIIGEFHIFVMNGFEFQKQIQDEFQLPIIVMSKDNTSDIISMTLEHGATHYIVKPFCPEDLRDIWKYAMEAKKNKLFIDSLFAASEEEETSTDQLQTKKKCSKRKSFGNHQGEWEFGVVKMKGSCDDFTKFLINFKLPFILAIITTLSFTTFLFCL